MNDADKRLDELLKRGRVPERSEGYWEAFPKRVIAQLMAKTSTDATVSLHHSWAWGFAFATACLVLALGVSLWFKARRPAEPNYVRLYREIESMFPNQVRAIVLEGGGVKLELSDKPDIPSSSPLRVDVCHNQQCRTYITFSGQRIRVNTESWDVLSDGVGHVLVVGRTVAWTSAEPNRRSGAYHIDAELLESSS